MKLIRGAELPEHLRAEVLRAYTYRSTRENAQRATPEELA